MTQHDAIARVAGLVSQWSSTGRRTPGWGCHANRRMVKSRETVRLLGIKRPFEILPGSSSESTVSKKMHATTLLGLFFLLGLSLVSGGYEERKMTMELVPLGPKARCLDGSEAGYYFRHGLHDGVKHWVIYLEGSGWCFSEEECLARADTISGSSREWPDQINDVGGLLGSDPVHNPDLAHWTHVYAPSCDGSSFSSNRSSPLHVGGRELHFSGAAMISALLDHLSSDISSAKRVLIAGSGSGGLAVLLHIDSIGTILRSVPGFKGDVVGVSDSAFIPHTVAGSPTHAVARFMAGHALWQPVRPMGGCEEGPAWTCLFSSAIVTNVRTPIHITQSTHDCAHIKMCMQKWEGMSSSVAAGYQELLRVNQQTSLAAPNPQDSSIMLSPDFSKLWEQSVRAALDGVRKHKSNGLYILSCPAHSQLVTRCSPLSDPNTTAAVMQAGSRGAVSTSAGLEWSACSMCGGWNKHYVKVGCQMISIRPLVDGNDTGRRQEGFGDWYFSWPWKGGYAEYTKVIDSVEGGGNQWCTR